MTKKNIKETKATKAKATETEPQQAERNEAKMKIADLEKQVEELQSQIADLEEIKLRQMAEFENYRRRTQKEKLELMDNAGERIFTDMLPLVDDMERALGAANKYENMAALQEGLEMIYQKYLKFLTDHKVTVIETEDKDFSTDEHEAITLFNAGEDKKGKIIDCTQKGYKLGEKVIRFAKVVVGE